MTTVQIDKASLSNVQFMLKGIKDEAPKILARVLNSTVTKARTEGSKAIRSEVRLSAAYVRDRMQIRKANFRSLQSRLSTPSRGILLSMFSTQTIIRNEKISWIKAPETPKRGIKVKVKPSGAAKTFTGDNETTGKPFYLALKNGRLAIAARRLSPGPQGGKVKIFHGPSLSQVFNNVIGDLQQPLANYQEDQVSKQIDSVLRGY